MMRSLVLPFATALALLVPGSRAQADPVPATHGDAAEAMRTRIEATPRAIRRDVPLTRAIQRAMKARTRDFTGSPGPAYWQLQTDFTIEARLDRATQSIFGKEQIVVHNHSPDELSMLVLRLDHNINRPRVPRAGSVPAETTDGMVVTRLAIEGEQVDLAPRAARRARTEDGATEDEPRRTSVSGLDQTVAVVRLAQPI